MTTKIVGLYSKYYEYFEIPLLRDKPSRYLILDMLLRNSSWTMRTEVLNLEFSRTERVQEFNANLEELQWRRFLVENIMYVTLYVFPSYCRVHLFTKHDSISRIVN